MIIHGTSTTGRGRVVGLITRNSELPEAPSASRLNFRNHISVIVNPSTLTFSLLFLFSRHGSCALSLVHCVILTEDCFTGFKQVENRLLFIENR